MHDRNNNLGPDQDVRPELPLGGLVRAAADDELTAQERQALDAHDVADLEQRVSFELALRESVGRVMGEADAPADLRARIAAAIADIDVDVDAADPMANDEPVVVTPMGNTRDPSFWDGTLGVLARWAGVAAVLALAGTLIISASRSTFTSPYSTGQAASLVGFLGGEHDKCGDFGTYYDRKLTYQSVDDAREAAATMLGAVPGTFDFQADLEQRGFDFAGLGGCAVPGGGTSVHLMYRRADNLQPVSVFVQHGASRDLNMPEACCLVDDNAELVVWQQDDIRYYVFSHDTEAVKAIVDVFDAPTHEHGLIGNAG